MSAVTVNVQGRLKSYGKKLTTTAETTIYTVPSKTQAVALGINLANIDGSSAVDVTVAWYDASLATLFYLTSTDSVAADAREMIDFPVALDASDEIRVTAGAANDLDVILTVVETPGNT